MDSTRAYKFRLSPDKKRQKALDDSLLLSQQLYNRLLEKTIEAHRKNPSSKVSQTTINLFMNEILEEDRRYKSLYAHVRVDIRNRLLRTYRNFFRRCKERKAGKRVKAGFPRFKARDRYDSITHIEDNGSFALQKEGKLDWLRVSKLGRIRIELHRQIEGTIKTLTIKRVAGKYYAIFTTTREEEVPKVEDANPVGIDMGLKIFAALSDGTKIQKPNFRKDARRDIAKWQRVIARRQKCSRRREKAKMKLQKAYHTANNQSDDYLHKVTTKLVDSGYTSFAIEDLRIQNMVKNRRLAKSINDASWNRFVQLLSYKAESAGMQVVKVDPRGTSKTCSQCGEIQDMPLSKREYDCRNCGYREDRDINAARNILIRATLGQRGSHARGDATSTPPARETASRFEETRTYSAPKEWNP